MFNKIIKWLMNPSDDKATNRDVERERNKSNKDSYESDSVISKEKDSESVNTKNTESAKTNQDEDKVSVYSVNTEETNKKDKEKQEYLDKTVNEVGKDEVGKHENESEKHQEYVKDIKQQVKEILDRRPTANGFITKGNLVINNKKVDYLECVSCGYIAHLDKENKIVKCSHCSNESEMTNKQVS